MNKKCTNEHGPFKINISCLPHSLSQKTANRQSYIYDVSKAAVMTSEGGRKSSEHAISIKPDKNVPKWTGRRRGHGFMPSTLS